MSMADGRQGGWWIFSTVTTSLRGRTTHTSPNILIDLSPHYSGVVVFREHLFTDGREEPEGLLLIGVEEENRGNDIHCLAVADIGVLQRICSENSAQCVDSSVTLVGLVFWQRSVQRVQWVCNRTERGSGHRAFNVCVNNEVR
jgi:hypothetical protein